MAVRGSRTISQADYSPECERDKSQTIRHSDISRHFLRYRSRQAIEIHPGCIALCNLSLRKGHE